MNLINYVDRTVDISAYQGAGGVGETLLRQTLADPGQGGTIVTGIVKLGQRFLIELLTEQGSLLYMPTRGCTFMIEARQGLLRTPADLFGAFTRAVIDVQRNLQEEDENFTREDEKFGGAEVDGVEFASGAARLTVRVYSLSAKAEIIVPVSLVL